ncbi:ABC transporter ATP-binding protein [Novosphingobium sp. Fuku2-ISO-50]|uniref:ABC transporter ATP-binding protein n=1 Tax=Novosphingobium sp. Fuku2-ISO-50 TaxID=1739114 RepID=UPI00076C2566|nr:ABC transporter ATP-binding protein [Novosphingobium sp. Fuku2-ISO-50]KUR80015.1 ABC transporter [Novosphingobium sp. Fuku2-ISO-50]
MPDTPGNAFTKTGAKTVAIRAEGLTKGFGEGETYTRAVSDVSFEAYHGEILFVVGPSGSGKTTMLSMVSGILRPDAGSVSIEGQDIWSLSTDQLAHFRLNTIGFVFQDFHLFPRLTTAENVAIPLIIKRHPWDEAMSEARRFLEIVGLANRADVPPVKLSGGEQQRVAIARALIAQPDLLVLDEPTASLDGDTGRNIISFVRSQVLNDKRCILIITHDSRIFEFADRILNMEDGRVTGIEDGGSHVAHEGV